MENSSISNRMKGYENTFKISVLNRTPVIIRLDGKAFHTYTKLMPRPFYEPLHDVMVKTTEYLCQEIQTCVFGYTQSDEISILLKDWTNHKTQPWFNNEVQKIVSVSASLASTIFNDIAPKTIPKELLKTNFGFFDSRVFNVPFEEVTNYFIWRQQDATRNSINSLGQSYFSQKELNGKNTDSVQSMLLQIHNINWNNFDPWIKRGTAVKTLSSLTDNNLCRFMIDKNIPIFTQNREYIDNLLSRTQE
jgi:tRNA(His) guanylyltransferase